MQYGGDPREAAMAASIAMAESSGNPQATNNNSNGTQDRGLWQINSGAWGSMSTYDIGANVRAAIQISNNGTNWGPWSTYQNGAFRQFYNPSITPTGNAVAQTDGSGVSTGNSTAQPYMPAAMPVLSLDALRSQDPLVAAVVTSVPELQDIFQQAVAGEWSTDRFISAVQNSNWWKTTSDSARNALAQMNADPATWNQNISNLESKLNTYAVGLGAKVSNQTLYQIAVDAITNGYDQNDSVLRQKFAQFVVPSSGLHFGGQAGTDESTIRQAIMDSGTFLSEGQIDQAIQQIAAGKSTTQDVQAQLTTQAASLYPAYAAQINGGMKVSDIAAPYLQQASKLLEAGPGEINIFSPLIKQALQYQQDGKPAIMPLGDFETAVRSDPRWKQTDNAQDAVMANAHQVLQQFGLAY